MPAWLWIVLKKIVAPFLVSKAIDYAKEELKDSEVDDAINKVSDVAQKLHLLQESDTSESPKGHLDDATKQKALQVVDSALAIADMINKAL